MKKIFPQKNKACRGFTPTPFLTLFCNVFVRTRDYISHVVSLFLSQEQTAIRCDVKKGCRGFTLVEMIVSLGLFTAVILISIGALTSVVSANKKVQSLRVVMDNLNFTMESMARSMRVGSSYECGGFTASPNDCPIEGSSIISFRSINGEIVIFRLNNNVIQRSTDGGLSYLDMTSPEISIEKMGFFVKGAPAGDGFQPRVLFIAEGIAGVKQREQARFNIQTTISQRPLDT